MLKSRSRRGARRSSREWAVRGGIAIAALVIGYVSTTQSLASALAKRSPDRAHMLAPNDGRILANLAQQRSTALSRRSGRESVDTLARRALIAEPLAVPAITSLAISAEIGGDRPLARKLIAHSDRLSRRELGARLWLIEDAVVRNNVPEALTHYDIALRTSRSAPRILFPILASAIDDPAIAAALAQTVMRHPVWSDSFIDYLGGGVAKPSVSAAFLHRLASAGYPVSETAQVALVNALVGAGTYDTAWAYFRTLRKGVDRSHSRDPEFEAQLHPPSVLDWNPVVGDAGINATVGNGVFDYAVPPSVGGAVLRQAQFLPAGRYRLDGLSAGVSQDRASRPYWQLACSDGRELGRVELPNSSENGGRFSGEFIVKPDCKGQILSLVIRSSFAVAGATGQIKQARLAPVAGHP